MTKSGEIYSKKRKAVVECLDIDTWKHSLYNDLNNTEDFLRAQVILQEKMKTRLKDLQKISESLDTLTQWMNLEF